MRLLKTSLGLLILFLLAGMASSPGSVRASSMVHPFVPAGSGRHAPVLQSSSVTASDLILAMNTLRVAHGNDPLIVDPIVMSVAQATADIMAAGEMSWHIGDVRGRIAAAGYGDGGTVWATENFAAAQSWGIDQIMQSWADPDHMRPAVNPAYCHVGAGVSTSPSGRIYYVLQAAYTSGNACGPYVYPDITPGTGGPPVSQIIIPVQVATPDADGSVYHIVKSGQSLWAIAVAYQVTIADIEFYNNISRENELWVGQELFIPTSSTAGYATPTPVGMVVPVAPDEFGMIVHEVQPYQTLISISAAYRVEMNTILLLNGWNADWPLQVGQQLLIDPGEITDTPTPRSPLALLTPAEDGNYYHEVQSGETLSYIAGLYKVLPAQLMSWNGLGPDSLIFPGDRLILQVTPPAPPTETPGPPTETPSPAPTNTPSPTAPPSRTAQPTAVEAPGAGQGGPPDGWIYGALLAGAGLILLVGVFLRRNTSNNNV